MALLLLGLFTTGAAVAADLTVIVSNIPSAQGQVRIALHNNAKGFPESSGLISRQVPAQADHIKVNFNDLPQGIYAVSAYLDINDNGKLDTNIVGYPLEPYGISRGVRGGAFGPPSFSDASFRIGTEALTEEIRLK